MSPEKAVIKDKNNAGEDTNAGNQCWDSPERRSPEAERSKPQCGDHRRRFAKEVEINEDIARLISHIQGDGSVIHRKDGRFEVQYYNKEMVLINDLGSASKGSLV